MAFVVSQAAKFLLEDARYRAGITRTPSRIEYIRRAAPGLKRVAAGIAGFVAAKKIKMDIDSAYNLAATQRSGKRSAVVGGHSVTQRGYARSKFGKRPTKKAKLALKLIKSTLSTAILRWQRIGKYEDSVCSFSPTSVPTATGIPDAYAQVPVPLGHLDTSGITNFGATTVYPVAIFDLTSIRCQMANNIREGNVGYLLSRGTRVNNYEPYFWKSLVGQSPSGFRQESNLWSWWLERATAESGVLAESVVSMSKRCYLDWCDIRINLYGAKKQATNLVVSLIQFNDRAWDPEKLNYQSPAVNNMRSEEEQRQYDAAWDEFLKPKVFNPMCSAGTSQNQLFKVLTSKKYTINPDLTNNEDSNPPNIGLKMFHHLNRVCKYDWSDQNSPTDTTPLSEVKITTDEPSTYPGPAPPAVGAHINEGLDSSAYNQQLNSNIKPYVHPRAKVFVMITAEAFTKVEATESSAILPSTYIDYVPSFDIQIRKKITFDSE